MRALGFRVEGFSVVVSLGFLFLDTRRPIGSLCSFQAFVGRSFGLRLQGSVFRV